MHPAPPSAPPSAHLLDVSMFWNAAGGVRRVLGAKHAALPAFGWRHTVLAPQAHGRGLVDAGGIALPGLHDYRVVLSRTAAARRIEAIAPDIVEAADPFRLAWASLDAARRLHIPSVAFCHSNLPAIAARLAGGPRGASTWRGRWAGAQARRYLVRLYGEFDAVFAPSRTMADRLRDWGVAQVVHQPLGVDCRIFDPRRRDLRWRSLLLARLGLPPATRLVVYIGRFAAEKNLHVVTEAVRLLGPGHALLAVGSGPQPPQGAHVRVIGTEGDPARLARLLASCDAFVHAGDQETFGLAALEAMACGVPVVVAAFEGLGELVKDAGLRIPDFRPRHWADAIDAALNLPDARLVDAALRRARAHDWPHVADRMDRRYRRLIGARAGVPPSDAVPGERPERPLAQALGADAR